ncbi:unnamed protein product [Cuscuta epithymum]|uniref:Uncharacterized protein n=1 Tax=Cuscuta epithymum TaxID=186058 RepID=A0AAV0FQB8_9ASTE|nr:unnamed protein product [Cuscuta epithymum]
MPPEPSPWDRKDFFRERKHERSELSGGGGGGSSGFGGSRWREHPLNHHHYSSSRWASDFRGRYPSGHGKQGGWHMYPEESTHGFMASRSSEKISEEDSGRYSGSRGEGKSSRNGRENRGSFGQRDWRCHSWETSSPNGPGRMNETSDQRLGDGMMNYHSSQAHSDYANARDQSHSRDQHIKNNVNDIRTVGSTGQRLERENSQEWKHLKWTRSGSLSSRGSFSHSCSSKSMGMESHDAKTETHPRNLTPIQSPSGDATACVTSSAPLEETNSRKKPRLGWGEGLAKYEKKKVEGPEDSPAKIGTFNSGSNLEANHFSPAVLADKNPQIAASSDCASPTTPSSVACSSSPGIEEKSFLKETNADHNLAGIIGSPSSAPPSRSEVMFNMENSDVTTISKLNAKIDELLQSDDPILADNGFKRSTALKKLLSWKNDVSKVLEKTEFEIDMLENELKSMTSGMENKWPFGDQGATCSGPHQHISLEIGSFEDTNVYIINNTAGAVKAKTVDIDSPGSATSKHFGVPRTEKDGSVSEPKHDEAFLKSTDCRGIDMKNKGASFEAEIANNASACKDASHMITADQQCFSDANLDCNDALCDSIYAANRESANRVAEVFRGILPAKDCTYDISKASSSLLAVDPSIKEKIVERKRQQQFKEKVLALKFRIFHHLWKEEFNMQSLRKFRSKSQKKFDLSMRYVQTGHQKHRFSSRSRPSAVGNLNLVPSPDLLSFTSRLLSNSSTVTPYRCTERMPVMILDKKEKLLSRFITNNALVEDPCSSEKERSLINPWTSEEREIFIDKLATFGKDFGKIASFLEHKTTAECIEFYYKNHKSGDFLKTKSKPGYAKQGKSNYLVASGKRWNRESNAAPSLDILGEASAMAAKGDEDVGFQMCSSKYLLGESENKPSNSVDVCNNDREAVAVDVLAGICGSFSSEVTCSCITSSIDHEWKHHKVSSSTVRPPVTLEVMQQNVDEETYSDESCGEMMDPADWTDEEKLSFIQAVSSYGKDFTMISRFVKTRSRDQCKVFFSKARKCLGLDALINPEPGITAGEDGHEGDRSDDAEGAACLLEMDSSICIEKKSDIHVQSPILTRRRDLDLADGRRDAKPDLNCSNDGVVDLDSADIEHISYAYDVDKELESDRDVENRINKDVQCDGSMISSCQEGEKADTVHDCPPVKIPPDVGVVDVLVQNSTEDLRGPLLDCSLSENINVPVAMCDDTCTITESGSRVYECLTKAAANSNESDARLKSDVSSSMLANNSSVPTLSKMSDDSTVTIASEGCSGVDGMLANLSPSEHVGDIKIQKPQVVAGQQQQLPGSSTTIKENGASDICWRSGRVSTSADCILLKCSSSSGSSKHGSSLGMEKSSTSGDFKLFGQILSKPSSSSQQNSSSSCNSSTQRKEEQSTSLKDNDIKSSICAADGVSSSTSPGTFRSSSENHLPLRSYSYWGDGNMIQNGGFSTLPPESAILLAKYPAAFGNFAMTSSSVTTKGDGVVTNSERGLNGVVPVFPREILVNGNGVAADLGFRNREVQAYDVVSGMPQGRGKLGINVVARGGGILVGQCSGGLSDPVVAAAAIKMHYAKADQFGEEDAWRGKTGELGSRL